MLSPDEAFAALGNKTRMDILRTLAIEDTPLSFSALRERVAVGDSGQFNYHLGKLDGHFITKTDAGYELRQAGQYLVQAVLSGTLTETPELEPTAVDFDCLFCGTDIEVSYTQGMVRLACPSCYERVVTANSADPAGERIAVSPPRSADVDKPIRTELQAAATTFPFPPAGVRGRSAIELQAAAATWIQLDAVALSSDVCPRCSAAVDLTIDACADHDPTEMICSRCGSVHAVRLDYRCRNCTYTAKLIGVMGLLATPEVLAFVGDHGFNVTSKGFHWGWEYGEAVHSVDPFEGVFTFDIDGDRLALRVDDELNVLEAVRTTATES